MNQKDLTKKFMMLSNWKKPFDCDVFYKLIQRFEGYNATPKYNGNTQNAIKLSNNRSKAYIGDVHRGNWATCHRKDHAICFIVNIEHSTRGNFSYK